MSRGQHEETLVYLLAALTAFKTPDGEPIGDLERNVRQQLVQTYEVLEHRQDATEHLLALGANQDWFPAAEPVFRAAANLPAEVIEKQIDGQVTLSFTVDEAGFVVDPIVSESTASALNDTALTMVQGFRYAPRFVDGMPVATDAVHYTATFNLSQQHEAAVRRNTFTRPPIKEMMLPDRFDISGCFESPGTNTDAACEGLGGGRK